MSKPSVFPYTKNMDQCAICDGRGRRPQVIGHYLVGNRGAIAYPVCVRCAPQVVHGMAPDLLKAVDQKMERRAIECGLTQTH